MPAEPDRIRVIGDHDDKTVAQLRRCVEVEEDARGVLCADGHLGYSMPIGGAVAYHEHVSPAGVGFDIGCGVKGVRTDVRAEDLDVPAVMDEVVRRISFGVGRSNDEPVDHPVLDAIRDADFAPQRKLYDLGAKQLGTVGAGNHWVDLFVDQDGWLWVGTHFGSRGFGHKTASGFLSLGAGGRFDDRPPTEDMEAPPLLLKMDSDLGQAYVSAMELAGCYAYAGRDVVVDKVLEIVGAKAVDEVHNHHNFAWRERHFGQDVWVVRKGCTPAFGGQRGFVGSSMGEPSVVLEGVENEVAEASLFSTVHGAGRAMSRNAAAGRPRKRWVNNVRDDDTAYDTREEALAAPGAKSARKVRVREGGAIDFDDVRRYLARKGIELRGGAADEAPGAYKRLSEVLAYHADSVKILHTLTPIGVAMAGADTFDPYKD
jgi:tRNA-splicing ligase RtcB (3'-phosphate/5'-hydroxy nucleic acid ligase)